MTSMPPPPNIPPSPAPAQSGSYATWGSRVLAYLVDGLIVGVPVFVIFLAGTAVTASGIDEVTGEVSGGGAAGVGIMLLAGFVGFAFQVWNVGWRQGTTGQSIGKGVMKIAVIRQQGGYLGGGMGIARMLVHSLVGGACFVNYLWPLWDDANQTWTDKILSTIVVDA